MTQAFLTDQIRSSIAMNWEREEQPSILDQFGGNLSAAQLWMPRHAAVASPLAPGWSHTKQFAIYLHAPEKSPHFLGSNERDQELDRMMEERETAIKRLRTLYVFDDPSTVINFLRLHRTVSSLLAEAVPFLRRCFDVHSILRLRVVPDENSFGTIYGLVEWKSTVESARKALRTFDEDWWIAASSKASGKVMFDYQLA